MTSEISTQMVYKTKGKRKIIVFDYSTDTTYINGVAVYDFKNTITYIIDEIVECDYIEEMDENLYEFICDDIYNYVDELIIPATKKLLKYARDYKE